jgi:hypothetical protein
MIHRLAAAVLALALPAAAQPGAEGRRALLEGDRLWRLKRTRSALAAYQKAAQHEELAGLAQLRMGRIYLFKGAEAEAAFPGFHEEVEYREKALAAFEEALRRAPESDAARHGRWKALRALGRDAGPEPVLAVPADTLAAEEVQKLRAAKKYAELVAPARAFAARFPDSEQLPAVSDALLEALQAAPETSPETLAAAIDARIAARPDPAAFLAAANLLLARNVLLDKARQLAEDALPAAQTFIEENAGSYKLTEKARGSLTRARASSADLAGWALFQKGDLAAAEARLLEAERLSRAQDFANQAHLAELFAQKGAKDQAKERSLNALSLAGGAPARRSAAQKALAALHGGDPAEFEPWLNRELERRREERRSQLLASMVDKQVPELPLKALSGEPFDQTKLRGRVLLYKFFASW